MLQFAVIAAVTTPQEQPRATVRIVHAQRITRDEWVRSNRKREVVIGEGERKVTVRLIEFE